MRYILAAIVTTVSCFFIHQALGCWSCPEQPCKAAFLENQLVFVGQATETSATTDEMRADFEAKKGKAGKPYEKLPDQYTDFKVTTAYKGIPGDKVRIYYQSQRREPGMVMSSAYVAPPIYPIGAEQFIFAADHHGFFFPSYGPCDQCKVDDPSIKEMRASYDALDGLIKQFPSTADFYVKKADLYEKNKDFMSAAATYEKMFSASSGAKDNKQLIVNYGRTLYFSNQFEKALQALQPVKDETEAASYIQLSLLRIGKVSDLTGQRLNFSGQTLQDLSYANADFTGSDFSGANLQNVKMENVKIAKSNFAGAKLHYTDMSGVDAGGSNFDQAMIEGKISSSKFVNAKFTGARVDLRDGSGNDFTGADFSGGELRMRSGEGQDFSNAKFVKAKIYSIGGAKTEGADFTGASFFAGSFPGSPPHNKSLNLAGQNLNDSSFQISDLEGASFKGATLQRADFRGSEVKGADFREADLTGADFGVSQFHGPANVSGADFSTAKVDEVKWTGASYDCATKFPTNFSPADNMMSPPNPPCAGALVQAPADYSWEKMLQPPARHYRLMEGQNAPQFKNSDFTGVNFEGQTLGPFDHVNLRNANFRYTRGMLDVGDGDLQGVDFSYSRLGYAHYAHNGKPSAKGAKLYCAYMDQMVSEADFSQADWTGAIVNSLNFQGWPDGMNVDPIKSKVVFIHMPDVIKKFGPADFSKMDFSGCDFNYVEFGSSNLSGTKFKGAYLYSADFTDANLANANFDGARITKTTRFPNGFDLSKFKFVPTGVVNGDSSAWAPSMGGLGNQTLMVYGPPTTTVPNFPGEDFSKLSFAAAWLPGSDMKAAKMRFTDWRASNLTGANFSEADATGAVFFDTLLDNADMTKANLYGADFRGATLKKVKLDGATLKNVLYDDKTVWPEGFDPKAAGAFLVTKELFKPPY